MFLSLFLMLLFLAVSNVGAECCKEDDDYADKGLDHGGSATIPLCLLHRCPESRSEPFPRAPPCLLPLCLGLSVHLLAIVLYHGYESQWDTALETHDTEDVRVASCVWHCRGHAHPFWGLGERYPGRGGSVDDGCFGMPGAVLYEEERRRQVKVRGRGEEGGRVRIGLTDCRSWAVIR